MPNIRVRPTPQGFGRVAPGGGAAIGAALQGAGQAVGAFAELQTNRELLDIRTQVQADALEAQQVEKLERSEAMTQIISKQIARNEASELILSDAGTNKNYDNVQKDMDAFEEGFNQNLFEGRSQQFQDIFLSADQSRRLGNINKTGTAVEAGRLRIMVNNFQASSRDIIDTVTVNTPPSQIREDYEDLKQFAASLGVHQELIEQVVGRDERAAFDALIAFSPVTEGLALLSNEDVTNAFTGKELQIRKRDQINKITTLSNNREIVNISLELSTGIDALEAFNNGVSQTDIVNMIEGKGLSETQERDELDFVDALFITQEKGPAQVSSRELADIHSFSEESMDLVMDKMKIIEDRDDLSPEQKFDGLFELSRDAMAVFKEAVALKAQGKFTTAKLNEIRFQMWPLTAKLKSIESTAQREGIFAPIMDFVFGPNKPEAPSNLLLERRRKMVLGKGRYSQLDRSQRSLISAFMTDESLTTDRAGEAMSVEEANTIANEMEARAFSKFFATEQGLSEQQAQERTSLFLGNSEPATEAIQQPQISGLADMIRSGFDSGMTEESIREQAREFSGFSDQAFDRAVATVDRAFAEAPALPERTALSGELGTLQGQSGTVSTEISVTVTDPRLNDGEPTNIPTLVQGQVDIQGLVDSGNPTDEQIEIAITRAIERQGQGASLPFFESIEQAEQAAVRRHESEERRTRR